MGHIDILFRNRQHDYPNKSTYTATITLNEIPEEVAKKIYQIADLYRFKQNPTPEIGFHEKVPEETLPVTLDKHSINELFQKS